MISLTSFGQQLEKGPEVIPKKDKYFDRFAGEDKNGFYTLRVNFTMIDNHYYIDQYNKTTLKKIKTIDAGNYLMEDRMMEGSPVVTSGIKVILRTCLRDGKLYIFSKAFESTNRSIELLADVISLENGERIGSNVILSSVYSFGKDIHERKFFLNLNYDSTKVIVAGHSTPPDNPETTSVDLYALDGLKKIWHKEIMTRYQGMPTRPRQYEVNDSCDLFCFFVYKDTLKKMYSKAALACFPSKDNANTKILPLDLPAGSILYNPSMRYVKEDERVYFACNIKDPKSSKDKNAGLIYSTLNARTFAIEKPAVHYFSESTKRFFTCDSPATDLSAREFSAPRFVKLNGGLLLYNYIDAYGMINYKTYHYSESCVVMKLDSNRQVAWETVIPRTSYYRYVIDNNDVTGLSVYLKNNKLNFLYLDDPINAGIKNEAGLRSCHLKASTILKNISLINTSIDASGRKEETVLFKNEKETIIPPDLYLPSSKGCLVRYKLGQKEYLGFLK